MLKNIRIGTVSSVNKKEGKASVYYEGYDETTTDYLDSIEMKGQQLKKGDEVLVAHLQEDLGNGVIIGKIHEGEFQEQDELAFFREKVETLEKNSERLFKIIENFEEALSKSWEKIYPVGSIYISLKKDFDPNAAFGGTWEKLPDDFYLTSTTTGYAGQTVGDNYHTITANELPSHTHVMAGGANAFFAHKGHGSADSGAESGIPGTGRYYPTAKGTVAEQAYVWRNETDSTGSGQAIDMRPKSKLCYMWQRIT